jgi:hypothetical protein
VERNPNAREQQPCQRLAEERGDHGIDERHPGCADAERVRGQMQAALHDADIEQGIAVPAVVEQVEVNSAR